MFEKLETLIDRSFQMHEAVYRHVEQLSPCDDLRAAISFDSGALALEHASSSLELIDGGRLNSAMALMRPQFETLVRGIWLAHAASDLWVEKLAQPLTVSSEKQANDGPTPAEMLKQLEAGSDSPHAIVDQLKEFKAVLWKPLSGFTHGGIHPLSRQVTGYSPQLVLGALRNSNGLLGLTAQLMSLMTGDVTQMGPVRQMHQEFSDCLPLVAGR